MGNVEREKMGEPVQQIFFQHNFSQSSLLSGRKLQLMAGTINRNKGSEADIGLPIDLSKREDESDVENDPSNDEDDEASASRDEPLNLSTNGGNYVSNDAEKRETRLKDEEDLVQKRMRLEEMVSYIRKCSVVEDVKYRIDTSSYAGAESEVSESDSENDERSVNSIPALSTCSKQSGSTSGCRRMMTHNGGIRASDGNAVSYPVLRHQLLRSASGVEAEAEEDEESESEENCPTEEECHVPIGPDSHWTAYHYASYYASVLHRLQASLPIAAAAQGLLVTAASAHANASAKTKCSNAESETGHNACLRKRAPRALTGKHVKHGTGASPATLLTLRQKIEQKMNQQQTEHSNTKNNALIGKRSASAKRSNKRKGNV